MRRLWIFRGIRFVLFAALAVAILGFVVMSLWNWLIPSLTGWHTLGFGQALVLLVLCRILFGGFRGRGAWAYHGARRWAQLSPEERDRIGAQIRSRCGRRSTSENSAASQAP
jgi:hypothetical protein